MINTFLKIGGVKSIEDFYKKYASEEDFFNAHPEARQYKHGGVLEKYQEEKDIKMKPLLTKGTSETVNQPNPRYIQDLERQKMLKREAQESGTRQYEDYKEKQLFWNQVARERNPNFKEGYAPQPSDEEKRAIQNKIDNPLLYNPAGTIASYGTRFEGMSPEEIASSYGNTAPLAYEMMANEALGYGVAKAIPAVGSMALKGLKKVGNAINPMTGMKQVRAAYPNLTENAYNQINASHHPIFYNVGTSAFGAMAPVMNEVITGNGDADPEELMKQMAIGAGAGFVGGNMLRNKGLMKQVSKFLPEYEKWDANMAGLKSALDQVPHKAWKNMNTVEREAWLDAVEKQKYINSSNLGNPAGSINDIAKSKSKYPFDYGDLSTPVREGMYPVESGSGNIRGDWFDFNQTGYTDIPSFNRQVDELKSLAYYGKRPLEKNINIKNINKPTNRLADDAMTSSESDIPLYPYFNNKIILDEDYLPSNMRTFGRQQFERLQPNKYGGTTNKPCYECGGSYQDGGFIPQEFLSGGDVKNIMKQLIKRQEGGNGAVGKTTVATSIDGAINNIHNNFMTTVQNNTERAFAQEELQKLQGQHQMPDGSMMDNSMMSQGQYAAYGGEYLPKAQVGAVVECTDAEKMNSLNPRCYIPGFKPQLNQNLFQQPIVNEGNNPGTDIPLNEIGASQNWYDPTSFKFQPQTPKPFKLQETPFSPSNIFGSSNREKDVNNLLTSNSFKDIGETQGKKFQENMGLDKDWRKEAAKVKAKEKFSLSGMDKANLTLAGINAGSNFLEGIERRKQEAKQNTSFDAYGMVNTQDTRGDYDLNSGMFRPNSYVPVQYAGTNMGNAGTNQYYAQMGGANPNSEENEVWLDDEEIEQIKKMGGTITYLD